MMRWDFVTFLKSIIVFGGGEVSVSVSVSVSVNNECVWCGNQCSDQLIAS